MTLRMKIGGRDMNSIDNKEMLLIKEISDKLGEESEQIDLNNPYMCLPERMRSYFVTRNEEQNKTANLIKPYQFQNADEIKEALNTLWKDRPDRQAYILPLVVATLKHKGKKEVGNRVSEYIYEF